MVPSVPAQAPHHSGFHPQENAGPRHQELMVINHGEEREQHQWGPALFLGDNLSAAGQCYGIGAKSRQERPGQASWLTCRGA